MKNPLIAARPEYAVIKTVWLFILDCAFDGARYQSSVFRMNKRHCVTGNLNFSWLQTEDAIEFGRPGHGVTAQVPVPTSDVSQVLRFCQLTLALLELLLRLLAIL